MTLNPVSMTTGFGIGHSSGYYNNGASNSVPATDISGLLTQGIGSFGSTATNPSSTVPTTADGSSFADLLSKSVGRLQTLQSTSDRYAAQAATGDLENVHDYMIASSEARLATDAVVTIKNKAVDAFNEIMRMSI